MTQLVVKIVAKIKILLMTKSAMVFFPENISNLITSFPYEYYQSISSNVTGINKITLKKFYTLNEN